MKSKCLLFLLFTALLQPCFSQSLSEQIETEAQKLESLQKSYKEVENKLIQSEQNLEFAEKSLQIVTTDLQELFKDYEKSQKKLKFWRTSLMVVVPLSIIGSMLLGVNIEK